MYSFRLAAKDRRQLVDTKSMTPEHHQKIVELIREVLDLTRRAAAQIESNSALVQQRVKRTDELIAEHRRSSFAVRGR